MIIQAAQRLDNIQEYYFSRKNKELAALNASRKEQGLEAVINLGVGAPDMMPPATAIEALVEESQRCDVHKYQSYRGIPELREAFARWYSQWYSVQLDPNTQIQPLVGSKEGILLLCMAFLNAGDKVLVPDPGYPTYSSAASLVQAEIIRYDILAENSFYPDFDALESMDLSGVKMMWVNYPNMPTGAPASIQLYERLVDFGQRHGILICNDNPYSFVLNDKPLSIMSIPGAFDSCVELNSLSKAHNMSGWRIGMVCASAEIIETVLKVKSQMDSGMFRPLQMAAIQALGQDKEWYVHMNQVYSERKEVALRIMEKLGAEVHPGAQGLFVWGRLSGDNALIAGYRTHLGLGERMSDFLLYEKGVFITPGMVFGHNGQDYIRISLCADKAVLEKVLKML